MKIFGFILFAYTTYNELINKIFDPERYKFEIPV